MPERIVDVLEVVEVEKKDGQMGATTLGEADGLFDPVIEQDTIRQIGEEIAVSYTHLDVYKRQVHDCFLAGWNI